MLIVLAIKVNAAFRISEDVFSLSLRLSEIIMQIIAIVIKFTLEFYQFSQFCSLVIFLLFLIHLNIY